MFNNYYNFMHCWGFWYFGKYSFVMVLDFLGERKNEFEKITDWNVCCAVYRDVCSSSCCDKDN